MNLLYLKEFIERYNFWLKDTLTYNSYWVRGKRDSYRPWESISVSEILDLIIDDNFNFVKKYYKDELKQACEYWTKTHWELEKYWNGWLLSKDNKLHVQVRLALIRDKIKIDKTEKIYSLQLEWIPIITGTIDVTWSIRDNEYIIDYKTSSKSRNYLRVQTKIQLAFYMHLSNIKNASWLYLNQKDYTLQELSEEEKIYFWNIVSDLIEYTKYLFSKWQIINLANKQK